MLRTNSKKVREAVKNFIIENYTPENYGWEETQDFNEVSEMLKKAFYDEKVRFDKRFEVGRISHFDLFEEWCGGLPSIFCTDDIYLRSAVDLVGDMLEQTEEERNKYSEKEATLLMVKLIYRELYR